MSGAWIEHRREDGERVGWIRMVGEQLVAVDVQDHALPFPVPRELRQASAS